MRAIESNDDRPFGLAPLATRSIVVDWSGRQSNEARYIWLAEAVDGELVRLESGRTRPQVIAELIATAAHQTAPLLIGLDFSFSFPAWFVKSLRCTTAVELWPIVASQGESWMTNCAPPFWGRPGKPRPSNEQFRRTETNVTAVSGIRPKSTFQIGGAGSVGTGSLRGMPYLTSLRQAGCAIWPFDSPSNNAPSNVTVCEVYPRHLTGPVVKSDSEARRKYLANRGINNDAAVGSEDAFDALISALVMSTVPNGPTALPPDGVIELEGQIFTPDHLKPNEERLSDERRDEVSPKWSDP